MDKDLRRITLCACFLTCLLSAKAQFTTSSNSVNNINNTNTGNVGIGTSNPWDKLEVAGNLRLYTGNADGPRFIWYGGTGGVQEYRARIAPDGHLAFFPSEGIPTTLALAQNRNVGIGINNPWARLDVRTNGTNAGDQNALNLSNPSNDPFATVSITMGLNSEASSMISAQRSNQTKASSLFFQTSDAGGINQTRLWINEAGNVGVGTSTPYDKMQVNGKIRSEMSYDNGGIGGTIVLGHPGKTGTGEARDWAIYNMSGPYGNSLQFWAYDQQGCVSGLCNNRFTIMDNGNVGIGTSITGSYKLAVEGTIGARKVRVTTSPWADYVFEKDYHLMSLQELEKFIQLNKHLPEVPTTKEVEKNGVDLGDTQVLLLKKIEELTLYVIQQQKELEELRKELKEIKKN